IYKDKFVYKEGRNMKTILSYFVFFLAILQISHRLVAGQNYEFQSGINHGFVNSRKNLYKHAIPRILTELGELASREDSTTADNNVDLTPKHQSLTASKMETIHVRAKAHINPDEELTTEDYPRPRPNHPSIALSNEEFTTEDYPRPRPNHPGVTLSNEQFTTEDYPRPRPNHP
ncbi:Os11g0134600, partial [Oryza sativa Japonica Group]